MKKIILFAAIILASVAAFAQNRTEKEIALMLDTVKFERYTNRPFNYTIELPTNFRRFPIHGDSSAVRLVLDDVVRINIDASESRVKEHTPYNQMNARIEYYAQNGDQVRYQKFIDSQNAYIISGNEAKGLMFYEKTIFNDAHKVTVRITYKKNVKPIVQKVVMRLGALKFM